MKSWWKLLRKSGKVVQWKNRKLLERYKRSVSKFFVVNQMKKYVYLASVISETAVCCMAK